MLSRCFSLVGIGLILGLKRLSIFAYRLTVNTNDRFIGLTIIDLCDLGQGVSGICKQQTETVDHTVKEEIFVGNLIS